MFLCDIFDSAADALGDLGLYDLPVIGSILLSIVELIWDMLGCG